VLFLAAYWLYIDGVNTVIKMAVDYGLSLGFDSSNLVAGAAATQFVAFRRRSRSAGSAGASGRAGAFSSRSASTWRDHLRLFHRRVRDFFVLAVVVGLVQGGIQSLSRSYFGRLVPEGKSSEFFGFYNMMGKFAAVLGPLLTASWPRERRSAVVDPVDRAAVHRGRRAADRRGPGRAACRSGCLLSVAEWVRPATASRRTDAAREPTGCIHGGPSEAGPLRDTQEDAATASDVAQLAGSSA